MPQHRRSCLLIALGLAIVLMAAAAVSPHERQVVGQYRLTIGWGDEPAFSGLKNAVEIDVSDAAGAPVTDPEGSLAVEVSFGDERTSLALMPSGRQPGKFRAWLVPTRPGTYAFHITGKIKGQTIDASSTCSAKTFACVTDVSDVQFPARDPSTAQLADRLSRTLPRVEGATDAAATARNVAFGAIAVAVLALAVTITLGPRKGTKGA
jgi:hypothetical protein